MTVNKAIKCSRLRACGFCTPLSKKKSVNPPKATNAGAPASVQGAQSMGRDWPRCDWWHLNSGARVSRKSLIRAGNSSGPEIVVRAAGECLIWTHGMEQWGLVCKEVTPAPRTQCHVSAPRKVCTGQVTHSVSQTCWGGCPLLALHGAARGGRPFPRAAPRLSHCFLECQASL